MTIDFTEGGPPEKKYTIEWGKITCMYALGHSAYLLDRDRKLPGEDFHRQMACHVLGNELQTYNSEVFPKIKDLYGQIYCSMQYLDDYVQ